MSDLKIVTQNGKFVADSRDVAEMIGKEHKNLLRDIRNYVEILGKTNFELTNFFIESYYTDSQNKPRIHYFLTKKGCDMVANKMIGEKGILFTAAYVTKFEEMEKQIQQPFKLPTTYKEALLQLVEKEERNEQLEHENALLKPKATYFDLIMQNKTLLSVTAIAKDYGMGAPTLNRILHELGVQYKQGPTWFLYHKYQDKGYTQTKTHSISEDESSVHTYWTQRGRLFIYKLLKEEKDILPIIERDNEQLRLIK